MGKNKHKLRYRTEMHDIFREVVEGDSFSVVGYRHKMGAENVKALLSDYKPYRKWIAEVKSDDLVLKSEIRKFRMKGKSIMFLAEHFNMDEEDVERIVSSLGLSSLSSLADRSRRIITVDDVAVFARNTKVGSTVECGTARDGSIVNCRVLKKYPYIALTDKGCFSWNWLCIKNVCGANYDEEDEDEGRWFG